LISQNLRFDEAKVWHGGPVWFITGNPVVGYWVRKSGVALLFLSSQSFGVDALKAERKFKAAEIKYFDIAEVDPEKLIFCLKLAEIIQWDYKKFCEEKGKIG